MNRAQLIEAIVKIGMKGIREESLRVVLQGETIPILKGMLRRLEAKGRAT